MKKVQNSINIRLIRNIILVSTFFSIIATSVQLYSVYKSEKDLITVKLKQVERASTESLSLNLWQRNDEQIHIQLKNLLKLHNITYVAVKEKGSTNEYVYGNNLPNDSIESVQELTYMYNYTKHSLGTFTLQVSLSKARDKVKESFYYIAITQTIKTFIVAFIMLYIFSQMITKNLFKIADYADDMIKHKINKPLDLKLKHKDDEFSLLQQSLNTLYRSMYSTLEISEEQRRELMEMNVDLKEQVDIQENSNSYITETEIKEILDVLDFIKKDSINPKDANILQQDIKALEILVKRIFRA